METGYRETLEVELEVSFRGGIRISASISRATSFHFDGCGDEVDELVNLILTGLVNSASEKIFEEEGERAEWVGDFGLYISTKGWLGHGTMKFRCLCAFSVFCDVFMR